MYMLRIRHFIILKSIQYTCLVNVHNLRRSVVNSIVMYSALWKAFSQMTNLCIYIYIYIKDFV